MKITKIPKKILSVAADLRKEGSTKCDDQREALEKAFLDRIRNKKESDVLQQK